MRPFLEALNLWGDRAMAFAAPLFWQTCILLAVLWVLDVALRRRARAALRYALWSLMLLKLVLPPSLALPTGFGYWLAQAPPPQATSMRSAIVVTTTESLLPSAPAVANSQPPIRLRVPAMGLLAWVAGATGLLALLVMRSRRVSGLVRESSPPPEDVRKLLLQAQQQLHVRGPVPLRLSSAVVSPAVCGLWRPVVMVPRRLTEQLGPEQVYAVLLHELAHVQRRDVWVNCLQTLLQVVYWWHPGVWIANARLRRVREEVVDDTVMVALGSGSDTYPTTLLEVARLALMRPRRALGLVGIFESKGALRQRIQRLVDGPAPKSAKLSVAGAVGVLVCGAVLLPMARGTGTAAPRTPATVTAPSAASVLLDCRVLQVGDEAALLARIGPPTWVGTNEHEVWVFEEAKAGSFAANLPSQPGVSTLARPRLITTDGVTGTISVTQSTNLGGREIQLGPVCELTAWIRGSEVQLAVKATSTDFVRLEGDGQAVYSVNAVGYVRQELADVRVVVPDGGAALVRNPRANVAGMGPRWFLVLPSVIQEGGAGGFKPETPVAPATAPSSEALETRIYKVNPRVFVESITSAALALPVANPPQGSTVRGPEPAPIDAVRMFFAAAGVNLEPPNALYFKDRTGVLMVRATPTELELIQKSLEVLSLSPAQIVIEARFIEVPDGFVRSLNVGQRVGGAGATNEVRVLNDAEARTFLEQAEQTAGIDVMAAPRVITLSGRQCQIQILEQREIPPGVQGTDGTNGANGTRIPSGMIPTGPALDVIASVAEDGCTLEVTALATVTEEILGYDRPTNWGPVHVQGGTPVEGRPMPVMRTRVVAGGARVYTGQSLLLVGAVAAARPGLRDRVPVPGDVPASGRPFRGESAPGRQLLILITPTIVDPAGNVVHTASQLPFGGTQIPPQAGAE